MGGPDDMDRFISLFKWLALLGVLGLVIAGVVVWGFEPAATRSLRATPTLWPTPALPTDTPAPTATATPTATSPPTWTPTATATHTSTPTPSVTPTPAPTDTPTPEPLVLPGNHQLPDIAGNWIVTSSVPRPDPMPLVSQPQGTVNVLLLGMDRYDGDSIQRTDVMAVVSIFPDGAAVSMMSIPRDYYAWIPGWGLDKINTAYVRAGRVGYPGGGPALVKDTILYNFGIPVHYYALVDFASYRQIVDAVGGVDIVVECSFHDTYPDPESPIGQTDIDLEPGLHHLDGKFALWYVRSRWNTSDFDRHRRQQQVLRAILHQALEGNMLAQVPELWNAYQEAVETDMGLRELLFFASVARRLDERDIQSYFIRGDSLVRPWTAPNGGYVLVPQREAMQEFVRYATYPLSSSRASQRTYKVAVVNGSGVSGWGDVAVYRLALEGFEVVSLEDGPTGGRTTVIDYTTTAKGSPLGKLTSIYQLQPADVVAEPTEGSPVDFKVTLGWNYNPCAATKTNWAPAATPTPTSVPAPAP